jgi:hypothetical protein
MDSGEHMKVSFEKMKKSGLRKCAGHWKTWLRHSKLRDGLKKEENVITDCYDENGKCSICGGYKIV